VRIQGADGLMVRYAQCCQPVPGDPVVGYVTRGRGVSIHRADCPNLLTLVHEPERRLDSRLAGDAGGAVHRAPDARGVRPARAVRRRRRRGDRVGGPTSGTWTCARTTGAPWGSVVVEVENLAHLQKIIRSVRRIKGISEVARRERLDLQEE
jgi:Guanosine polyphosphate pyrophosphohydrolases/synthetases